MSKNNKETLQWIKKHLGESTMKNLKEEASIFFGALKYKRERTIKTKLEEFVAKEKSLKMTLGFQIMRAQHGEGPRGRNPPLNFKLKDLTLNGFISVFCMNLAMSDMVHLGLSDYN